MTHFNHDWDTTKNPAVPVSVGDRYYAQDLNDDFNYTKHLPYEVLLQNREDGVLIPPTPSYNPSTHVLSLAGGLSAKKIACTVLNEEETFVLPPKTKNVLRYERISLLDTTLTLPQNNIIQYIVATPTKRSLLERTKVLVPKQWYCREKYNGIITLQNTAPLSNQILIGLALNDEYLLLQDTINQCEKSICIKCWNGVNKISSSLITALQTHYSTTISTITGNIAISNTTSMDGIDGGSFLNCIINAVIHGGAFNRCFVSGKILSGTFKYCNISASVVGDGNITHTIFNHCDVTNIKDSANFTASNSMLTYPTPQNALKNIYADQCTIKIQATIAGDAFASFKDCKLTNVDVYTTNNPPTISPLETYLSSFVTWSQTGSPIVQLCTDIDSILDDNTTSPYKSWSSKKIAQNNLCINTMAVNTPKTIPSYYEEEGASLKVIFKNGHNAGNISGHMTINGKLVVSNKNGSLLPIPIHAIEENGSVMYKVIGANIALELYYTTNYDNNGTPAFVVIGNPIVLSSSDYTIYADGKVGHGKAGLIQPYYTSKPPYGSFACNGQTIANMATKYPELYAELGTEVLPDLRECSLVHIGQSAREISDHDVYRLGEFKNDQFKSHNHDASITDEEHSHSVKTVMEGPYMPVLSVGGHAYFPNGDQEPSSTDKHSHGITIYNRGGDTTHGKQVGVNYCIKAIPGI